MGARPWHAFEGRKSISGISINSTNPAAPIAIQRWALNGAALAAQGIALSGTIGFRLTGSLTGISSGGVVIWAVAGGTVSGTDGVASAPTTLSAAGKFTTVRLTVSLSSLFQAGREMEFLKFFGYRIGTDVVPVMDPYGAMVSGDELVPPDEAGGLPPFEEISDDLGVDLDIQTDMQKSFILAKGMRNLSLAICRRLSTPRGALALVGDDPDYGLDLRGMLNQDLTQAELQALGGEIDEELRKDERIHSADVLVTFTLATSTLTVEINLETVAGPHRLVLGVSERTLEVINEGLDQGAQ